MSKDEPATDVTFLLPTEAAKLLRISTRTLWKKVKSGIIPAHRVEGLDRILFSRTELEALVLGSCATRNKSRRGPKPKVLLED